MERQVHARAEAEWQHALDLEKKLKACSRKRSFYDAEVRSLRKQLRDTYESLLFLDAAFAAANDVEGQMWRTVFYLPIEEFRSRIRKAEKEAEQQQKAGTGPAAAVGGPGAATILAKTAAAFLKFLDEAALFYKRLVMQLQSAYGDVKVRLELPPGVPLVRSSSAAAADGVDGMQISTGSSIARDMRTSIHRCLVFLGDLSRYASQAAPKAAAVVAATAAAPAAGSSGAAAANTAAKAEWSKAVGYYRMAAHVLPRSGNPHNQLAVMAYMTGDELKAAYHYARSLCVHVPFMTARENLLQLLQNNRDRYATLCKQRQQQQQQLGGQQQGRPVLSMQQQLAELGTCYVRLVGLLYDRINQSEYLQVAKAAFEALAGFLDHPQLLALLQRQRQYDCTPLHMVVLSIFVVHHSFGSVGAGAGGARGGQHHEQQQQQQHHEPPNGAHSRPTTAEASAAAVAALNGAGRDSCSGGLRSYAGAPAPPSPIAAAQGSPYGDAAQRSLQRGRSLAMLFRTGRLLAQAATAAVNAEAAAAVAAGSCNGMAAAAAAGKTGATNLLVGLDVVLQWLAAQPNCAVLQAATATEEDVRARSKFWTAAGQLLLVLAPALNLYSQQQQQQQQQERAAAADGDAAAAAAAAAVANNGCVSAGAGVSGSMGADSSCEEGALPEDLELLGFEPMRSRHYWHVTDVGKHAVDETRTRIKRMLAAARVTSAALAAEQQAQLSSRHVSGSISAQALNQLGTAVQQFIGVVAMVAANKTPTASPKVAQAAALGQPGTASAAAAAAAGQPGQLTAPHQQQQQHGPTAMEIDSHTADACEQQRQQAQAHTCTTAAAAAAADGEECEEEEEVIVFKPRISRLSSPALDDASVAAAPAAPKAPAPAAVAAPTQQVVAAAGPPPLPQTLLAGRQASPSASSSPTVQPPAQQQLAHAAAQAAGAAGAGGGAGGMDRPSFLGRDVGRTAAAAAAAAAPMGVAASSGMLLQGHAATALDLQQAQAASDMLLARLNARQGPGAAAAAAAAPGFGDSMLAAQQQQHQQGRTGLHPGIGLPNGLGGQPALAGFAAPAAYAPGGFTAAGAMQQQQQQQLQQAGLSEDVAMEQALIGTGLATLLGGLGDELLGPSSAAGGGMNGGMQYGGLVGAGGWQGQQQPGSDALAAVSAALAASVGALGGAASAAGMGASAMGLGLDDPLTALRMLGIPVPGDTAAAAVTGLPAGSSSYGMAAAMQGFGEFSTGQDVGVARTVSAGVVAGPRVSGGGQKVSAPVGILQQAAADAASDLAREQQQQEQQQQQQLSSSYVANHQMEATAMDAANRVLSPVLQDSGMALLQQHLQQQQQQGALGRVLTGAGVADLAPGVPAAAAAAASMGGSWMSGSNGSTPGATTPRGVGGLSAALQQQQQQQLQMHMAQRRLSAGSASPRSAVGAERGSAHTGHAADGADPAAGGLGAEQGPGSRAARMSLPSFSLSAAAAAGDLQQQRQQRSSIGAMFAGPDLFGPHSGDQLPPVHRRVSSGSSGQLMGGAAAAAGGGGGVGGLGPVGYGGAGAAGGDSSLCGGDGDVNGLDGSGAEEGRLLPSLLGDVLQQPGAGYADTAAAGGGGGGGGGGGAAPMVLQRQQQQQQLRVVAESPDQGEGGLTLVEYLAAQQRKLLSCGEAGSDGLQAAAAAAAGADLSAHVLLPPLDFSETQNPFG